MPSPDDFVKRYPKAVVIEPRRRRDGPTEQDALVAYLQMLGTTVDFKLFDDKANWR